MKLNCLSCGHSVDLHGDYDDYNGQVKCFVCGALLTIRTEDGRIRNVALSPRAAASGDNAGHAHGLEPGGLPGLQNGGQDTAAADAFSGKDQA